MNHKEALLAAGKILNERAQEYGGEEACFKRISDLATIILNKPISQYDVAMILHCVKLGRLQEARQKDDNYIDGINYMAFAAQFADGRGSVETAMEDDIKAMAARLKPVNVGGVSVQPLTGSATHG
jgi:Domain of unknown function (DUF6378)